MNSKSLLSRRSIRIGMCLQAVNMIDCKNNMRAFEGMNKTVTVSPCLVFLLFRSIEDTAFLETRSYIEVKADEVPRTRFRDFVTQHLKPWHAYCDEIYWFDWDTDDENSKAPQPRIRKRGVDDDGEDLKQPKWCDLVEAPLRAKMRVKDRESLKGMLREKDSLRRSVGGEEEWESRLQIVNRNFPRDSRDAEVDFVV